MLAAEPAPAGFDARRDATSRTYCYRCARIALGVCSIAACPVVAGRTRPWCLEECARVLVGTHDFTAFTPTDTEHVRFQRNILSAEWRAGAQDMLEFWIEADTFMRHMIRMLLGTMLEVGSGRRTLAEFAQLLAGRPRIEAGQTAPAHGLALAWVAYPPTE